MSTVQQPTSAKQRKVQWKTVDRALARFSTESLLVLLNTALASPGCARFHDHLMMLWTRVLRGTDHGGAQASAEDLPGLVLAAVEAAPGRQGVTEREPNDVRSLVRFAVAGERLLVHPGELDHPMRFLRQVRSTALVTDDQVKAAFEFTLTDVLELVLRYSDHVVARFAGAWPALYTDREPDAIACGIHPGELQQARDLADLDLTALAARCADPTRARRALDWLTRPVGDLALRYHPSVPLLGPVLAVRAHGRLIPVPASAAMSTLATAVPRLLQALPASAVEQAEERLQDLTLLQVCEALGLDPGEAPAGAGPVCVISSPSHRYDIAVVSALADGTLGRRVEDGHAALTEQPAGRGRLVVYGGVRVLGPELIRDTLYLHIEELTEIMADAEGDVAALALFVLEMSEHPGVDAIWYAQPIDAWVRFHRDGTLLVPGPPRNEVAAVPPLRFDPSWRRAATWARLDDVLAAAGLPPSLRWRCARLVDDAAPDTPGEQADLLHRDADGTALARIATVPPLVIVTTPNTEPDAAVDLGSLTSLADAVRITITGNQTITDHLALPDRTPVVLQLAGSTCSHVSPTTDGAEEPDHGDGEDGLLLRIAHDPATARIHLDIDPPLLARFAGDGHEGHRVLGRVLHHLVTELRQARDAGPGISPEDFHAAWDAASPALRLAGVSVGWPATAPPYTVPRSQQVRVRALRTAAAAVRRAQVPAGSWTGADAYRSGGPGELLLHALEKELVRQIRLYQPGLVEELARHLNAAWATRTRGQCELTINLAAPWAANWTGEVGRRQAAAAASTSALQLLLQQALATPPAGHQPVDVLAIADLVALAELVLHCGTTAVAASRRLTDLHLEIHPSGVFTLTDTPDPDGGDDDEVAELAHLGFNAEAYQHARQQQFIRAASRAEPDLLDPDTAFTPARRIPVPYTAVGLPPGSQLAKADQLLRQHWGCGIAALNVVMLTTADWPTPPTGIATTTAQDLAHEAATWTGLPEADLVCAVERLLLHPANAAGPGAHAYTEVERRTRPTTHPLIADGDRILLLPWLAHTANELYAGYLADGRLPRADLPQPVAEALRRYRGQLDNRLEVDLKDVAEQARLPHRFRLLEKEAAQLGIPGLAGEIDLLVADPVNGRLWVIEAKNPEGAVAPGAVLRHVQPFTRHYRTKLLAKAETITAHAAAAASACHVDGERDWRVLPLFVTRTIEPAAFLADPQVPFTTAEHLANVLTSPTDPAPGWITPADPAEEGRSSAE
ncbi:hypothetical protein [Kitasatospora sp. NPDC093679]|uniref:hypothetical protein n=1 Tax=Kitasatospora sp. NPDC093679 TaxID=3154983 RepID=UPI0034458B97